MTLRAVFGGSFDPVHHGHLIVARSAAMQLGADVVHFVPAHVHPFKVGRHEATASDRVAMLELALRGEPLFVLDRTEVARGGTSYTVDTLRELNARHPGDRLCLLVGADAAAEFGAWREAARIGELAELGVLTRPGTDPPPLACAHRVIPVPSVAIAARDVRARARRGESIADLVPPAVAEYIAARGLYREG
jgi:nicotinate-nucleotide adenylyltransferase